MDKDIDKIIQSVTREDGLLGIGKYDDEVLRTILLQAVELGKEKERLAWMNSERCDMCGREMKPQKLTNTCSQCWEEE